MTQLSLEEMRANAIAGPPRPIDFNVRPKATISEEERQLRRLNIKEKIAEAKAKGQRAAVLAKKLAEIDLEADAAADVHGQTVAPLRDRLQQIDAETQRLFALHQPIPDALVDEQADIMGQIEQAGQVLKCAVDAVKERRRPVAVEVQRLRSGAGTENLVNELTRPPLANPDYLDQVWARQKLVTLFGAAVHAVANRQRTLGNHCPGRPHRYDTASERGQRVLAELNSELAELRERMINE